MEIQFNITKELFENMDAVDYEAFERAQDGDIKMYRLRPAVCRFMVDNNNVPIPYSQALKNSEKMKVKDVLNFIRQFFESVRDNAIPKGNGTPSSLPSEVPTPVSVSQVG